MKKSLIGGLAALMLTANVAFAQEDTVFIQIEARTSLNGAQQSVNKYTGSLQDVNGFSLGGGWYGVALGPYSRTEAQQVLLNLQNRGLIPADAYIEVPRAYGRQFWPVGAQVLDGLAPVPAPEVADPAPEPAEAPVAEVAPTPEPTVEPVAEAAPAPAEPEVVEETPRQARASERALNREQREELQIALKWAGVYTSGIDGAFGRGTRRAMAAWQEQNGFEETGILTTLQRAELLRQYNSILDGMDMAVYTDPRAGISVQLPMGAVKFDRYEAPFALFDGTGVVEGAQLLLISQPGDRKTMNGLYEIMQTLEIVPLDGERKREANGFLLTGSNARITSHTEVGLRNGEIKGFTLIWPTGDEDRRTRVLGLMQKSWQRTDGVLDPAAVTDAGQAVDLVSGLKVRTPRENASGFFVDNSGTVLTSAATVAGCSRVTLDGVFDAKLIASDDGLGVAALRPTNALAPRRVAAFRTDSPRLQSEVAVAGYSFGGRLSAPTLTFGTLEDLQGLGGETQIARLGLSSLPGDAGGPVFDGGGMVVGMMQTKADGGSRRLPEDVSFAAKTGELLSFLQSNGIRPVARGGAGVMAPEDLTALAADTTVLVSCWE
ncbi:trypsin-like peptidase domain-containing protein [Tropicibacter sp. R15_0]|uniref:serine protease n=1 Tax=Tropicibacter sp. R15_0 TaxID=2821101 RepID=UPI001ADBB897|nr:serine protease [Tropicibacter sp. R15_0]MBO9466140.1 trypsin-like peptidase domain-containing protein [Tropicibacter sp. R15_0]